MPKINDIEIMELGDMEGEKSSPWSSTIIVVRVTTSDGQVGYGEAPTTMMTLPVLEGVRDLCRILKGRGVTDIQSSRMYIYKHSFYLTVSMETTAALSAIEIACMDAVGKIYGMPVFDMLGGMLNRRVRAYANGWYDGCVEPGEFAKKAKKVAAMGFTGMKFDPFGKAFDSITEKQAAHAKEVVRTVRKAIGDRDIMIECHGRFSSNSAARSCAPLSEFEPLFVEEPVHPDQFEGLRRLRRVLKSPIALGERVLDRNLFLNYLRENLVDVLQPDITNCGGILEAKSIATMAESFGVEIAHHNAFGPIQTAATLNVDVTIPNLLIQESFEMFWPKWKKSLVRSGYSLDDGYFSVSGKPGLGISLDERILEEYKVKGMEPFNQGEPPWVVKGTFK